MDLSKPIKLVWLSLNRHLRIVLETPFHSGLDLVEGQV